MTRKIIATDSEYPKRVPNGTVMTVTHDFHSGNVDAIVDGGDGINWFMTAGTFEEYTAYDTPILWRDMTPGQKGALLLAHHEGEVIEYMWPERKVWEDFDEGFEPSWTPKVAYRIKPSKPEPKVETVTIRTGNPRLSWGPCRGEDDTHRITFNLIDGKPDCDMDDKLIERIKAHRAEPDVYDRADFLDMEARILADEKIIRAAEQLAASVQSFQDENDCTSIAMDVCLTAYRAAVAEQRG